MPVHSGMERFLPNDGIDAIEKRQFGRSGLSIVLDLASRKKSRDLKNTHERQKLFWREVWYNILVGTKIRAQPGAPTYTTSLHQALRPKYYTNRGMQNMVSLKIYPFVIIQHQSFNMQH